ncbi:MAG: hypothetical protein O7C59_02105 [Rickettsia endosymbiont of Ixodes persulcatus]|nr:hypothetical protein [Rickettsia endosymbiont of Ixodes persulcatus]
MLGVVYEEKFDFVIDLLCDCYGGDIFFILGGMVFEEMETGYCDYLVIYVVYVDMLNWRVRIVFVFGLCDLFNGVYDSYYNGAG